MTTRRNFLKLALIAPVAGAKLGMLSLEVKSKAAAVASRVNGFYTGMWVVISDGPGRGQSRQIIGYDGTTKVATLSAGWATKPDSTSLITLVTHDQYGPAPQSIRLDA